jgi:paired amphipathic helix protein Sin3a
VVPLLRSPPVPQSFTRDQAPLMDPLGPGPAVPPSGPPPAEPPVGTGGGVVLSDVMGRDRSINLFAGYVHLPLTSSAAPATYPDRSRFVRDTESAAYRLENSSKNTTVLAPLNSAVEKLPRKPWEDPQEYGALGPNAYEGGEGYERAQRNLRKFVEAHLVPVSPWQEREKVRTVGGDREIWWEEKDGTRLVSTPARAGSVCGWRRRSLMWSADSAWCDRSRWPCRGCCKRASGMSAGDLPWRSLLRTGY